MLVAQNLHDLEQRVTLAEARLTFDWWLSLVQLLSVTLLVVVLHKTLTCLNHNLTLLENKEPVMYCAVYWGEWIAGSVLLAVTLACLAVRGLLRKELQSNEE